MIQGAAHLSHSLSDSPIPRSYALVEQLILNQLALEKTGSDS